MTQPVFVPGDENSLSQTLGTSGVRSAQYSSLSGWEDWWRKTNYIQMWA